MHHLQLLSVANCRLLSDANLADIGGYPSLTGLNLRGCTIGDAGLHYLSTLSLKTLKLPQRHHVTDQGIVALGGWFTLILVLIITELPNVSCL